MNGASDESDKKTDEGFLARWSRRKAEAAATAEPQPETIAETAHSDDDEILDPASLPPIDSLTAESDFTLFLKKGVPPALRAAALRKLWLTEPSVVSYKPLVEYDWDFTAPGYGDLLPSDDITKFARHVFEGSRDVSVAEPPADAAPDVAPQDAPSISPPAQDGSPESGEGLAIPEIADAKSEIEPVQPISFPRRRHGGALPR